MKYSDRNHTIRFGQVAVQKGYVSLEQLKNAIKTQIEDDINGLPHRLVGEILMEMGAMDVLAIEDVLQELIGTAR